MRIDSREGRLLRSRADVLQRIDQRLFLLGLVTVGGGEVCAPETFQLLLILGTDDHTTDPRWKCVELLLLVITQSQRHRLVLRGQKRGLIRGAEFTRLVAITELPLAV